jgi:RNA polymerase sigma-70 factor (ECF subfamily)
MSHDDDKLAQLACRGNHTALTELLERFEDRVYSVCYRMTHHPDDALDCAQSTMLKIIQNITKFQANAAIGTWIYRIAVNESISHLRKSKVRQAISLDQQISSSAQNQRPATLGANLADTRELSPDQRVQKKETMRLLRQAMKELDPDHSSVLVLRDTQGLDYQQIGEILDLPSGTVKSRLFRARLALREKMLELESDTSTSSSKGQVVS